MTNRRAENNCIPKRPNDTLVPTGDASGFPTRLIYIGVSSDCIIFQLQASLVSEEGKSQFSELSKAGFTLVWEKGNLLGHI